MVGSAVVGSSHARRRWPASRLVITVKAADKQENDGMIPLVGRSVGCSHRKEGRLAIFRRNYPVRPQVDHRKWNNRLNGPHWPIQVLRNHTGTTIRASKPSEKSTRMASALSVRSVVAVFVVGSSIQPQIGEREIQIRGSVYFISHFPSTRRPGNLPMG